MWDYTPTIEEVVNSLPIKTNNLPVNFNEEILEELTEGFTPYQIELMAARAIDNKAQNVLIKYVSNKSKEIAKNNSFDDNLLIVAKKYFKYK